MKKIVLLLCCLLAGPALAKEDAVHRTAHEVGRGVDKAAHAVGHGVQVAARAIGQGFRDAARAVTGKGK
jgi:hypothetical protein